MEEKERIWRELDEVVEIIPREERVVICGDLNGHVGEGNTGDEQAMSRFGVKERNLVSVSGGGFIKERNRNGYGENPLTKEGRTQILSLCFNKDRGQAIFPHCTLQLSRLLNESIQLFSLGFSCVSLPGL